MIYLKGHNMQVLSLTPHLSPVAGGPEPYLNNLYNMLVNSKQKFGRFVRPGREKIEPVDWDKNIKRFDIQEMEKVDKEMMEDKEFETINIDTAFTTKGTLFNVHGI